MSGTGMGEGRTLTVRRESFPIRGAFRISRGAKTSAEVVVAEIRQGRSVGRGECVPYSRYGETPEGVAAIIASQSEAVAAGLDREGLARALPPGAARNALDCALWDIEAKITGVAVWRRAGMVTAPMPVTTAFTLSVDTPEAMAVAARAASDRPLLKLKLTGAGDVERVRAVREAVPQARLIADANEAWSFDQLLAFAPMLAALGVELIEQPLPADADEALLGLSCPVPLGADESCHGHEDSARLLARLAGRYQVVNIKLDKTGGLTEALRFRAAAEAAGFGVMVGCMVATSLAMAPALLVAQGASLVDLDGPLILSADREPGLRYRGAWVDPPNADLWG